MDSNASFPPFSPFPPVLKKGRHVLKALKYMRKAHVKHRNQIDDDEKILDPVATDIIPMTLRGYPEICKESEKSQKIKEKYEKIKNKGKIAGQKKRIFVETVDAIRLEWEGKIERQAITREKLKLALQKKKELEQQQPVGHSEEKDHKVRTVTEALEHLRGKLRSAPSSEQRYGESLLNERGRPKTANASRNTLVDTPSPKRSTRIKFGPIISDAAVNYLASLDDDDENAFLRENFARLSVVAGRRGQESFVDKKIKDVQATRLKLIAEHEAEIKKRIDDRIERRQAQKQREHLQALQTSWMMLVAQFSRFRILTGYVDYERAERLRWVKAGKDKKAVRVIELWWPQQFILYKLYKKFRWTRNTFASLFMNRLRKMNIAKRYAAQALIKQFVSDVTGLGETMRKVYAFRTKVIRSQRWIKEYFKLYLARMQVLWKALLREEEGSMGLVRIGQRIKSKKAKRAIQTIRGFGVKAKMIDQVSTNINSLLKFQENLQNRRHIKAEFEKSRQTSRRNEDTISAITNFRAEISSLEDGPEKLEFLQTLLFQLRQANIVKNDATKHRNVGNGPVADHKDAKIFLQIGNLNPMPKLADSLRYMEDPNVRQVRNGSFYMLTGNGNALDVIKDWVFFFMRKKYKEEFALAEEYQKNRYTSTDLF